MITRESTQGRVPDPHLPPRTCDEIRWVGSLSAPAIGPKKKLIRPQGRLRAAPRSMRTRERAAPVRLNLKSVGKGEREKPQVRPKAANLIESRKVNQEVSRAGLKGSKISGNPTEPPDRLRTTRPYTAGRKVSRLSRGGTMLQITPTKPPVRLNAIKADRTEAALEIKTPIEGGAISKPKEGRSPNGVSGRKNNERKGRKIAVVAE
jgi:hypothetical protein